MYNGKPRHWNAVSISVPDEQLSKIDIMRGDVTRSKWIQRVIEEHMKLLEFAD